jgi:hypothetical protein
MEEEFPYWRTKRLFGEKEFYDLYNCYTGEGILLP